MGYDHSDDGDFFMVSSSVYALKLPGKIRMRREVARAVRNVRRSPVEIELVLQRPLDWHDFYASVGKVNDEDYDHVTKALNSWFEPKELAVKDLKLAFVEARHESSAFGSSHYDLVTAEFTVTKR